jgi:hypothetical protein
MGQKAAILAAVPIKRRRIKKRRALVADEPMIYAATIATAHYDVTAAEMHPQRRPLPPYHFHFWPIFSLLRFKKKSKSCSL